MPAFRAPRGTRDLLPDDRATFDRLQAAGTGLASRYGYRPVETPISWMTSTRGVNRTRQPAPRRRVAMSNSSA